jgi:predicted nucleotidyltransferase
LIIMGFPLPLDPTPTTIEAVVKRLSAEDRARLEWFPNAFRHQVVQPLHDASDERFAAVVDEVAVHALRLFLRLAAVTAEMLAEPTAATLFESPIDTVHERIQERLGAVAPAAADDLREALEWLRAILGALLAESRYELALASATAPDEAKLSDDELRRELRGSGGALIKGLLLTTALIEDLYAGRGLPDALVGWCGLALREVHAAANALRADGVAVPTAVTVAGVNPLEWRHRRASPHIRPGTLPAGVMTRIVAALHPEEIWLFGSRGRGTHAPHSDWDLMVVVPDSIDCEAASAHDGLAPLRRARVDLVLVGRTVFDENRNAMGTLIHDVVTQGRQVYAG